MFPDTFAIQGAVKYRLRRTIGGRNQIKIVLLAVLDQHGNGRFCLAGLVLWTLLMYRTLSPAVLSRADAELPHSVCYQTGEFSAYVTESLLLLVTGAVLRVISLDKIISMKIKRSNMYKANYSYYLEIVTREKTYRPSFQRNYRNPDAEQVIADLIREVERRKG